MKITKFTSFKFIKSKFDTKLYLRMIFDGWDGTTRFLAFPVDRHSQLAGDTDFLSLEFRDYIRAQCMINEAKQEVEYGNKSTPSDKGKTINGAV